MEAAAFFLFLLVLIDAVSGYGYVSQRNRKRFQRSSSNDFDVVIFTQHWPQSVCFQWKEKQPTHTCNLPTEEEWTIHGIWPTQYHKLGPQFCNGSMHFDLAALQPIKNELNLKWIDVEKGAKPYSFWEHEWTKHGTCAAALESMNSVRKYFEKGLDLLDQYDMKNVLTKVNVVPGNYYMLDDFFNGVQKVLGVHCQVQCIHNPNTREAYIFEIRICFDKTMKLVNCDGIADFPGNCPSGSRILYPGTVPSSFQVIQM